MKLHRFCRTRLFLLLVTLGGFVGWAQNSAVSWWTIDAGFDISSASDSRVESALGQPFVGIAMLAVNRIESGFLVDTLLRGPLAAASEEPNLPETYSLGQNYPNPFNPATIIVYGVKRRESVELRVYDLLGREVATLVNEIQDAGFRSVNWNASGMASGVYFYRLRAGDFTAVKRMVMLK